MKTTKALKAALAKLTKKAMGRGMSAEDVSKAKAITAELKSRGEFYQQNPEPRRLKPGQWITAKRVRVRKERGRLVLEVRN